MFVPVTLQTGEKLMPTHPNKAGMLIRKRLATPYWRNGIFSIRLNYEPISPLEIGKQWFYSEVEKRWKLLTLQGRETQEIRDRLGLKKSSKKLSETFDAHCVDSWCLAYHTIGGENIPDNTDIFCISPIPIKRRELHRQQESKGRKRSRQGGTVLGKGLVKNTLVRHIRYGLTRLAGVNAKGDLFSIYNLEGNKRLTTGAKRSDFKVLTRLNFNYRSGHSSPC